MSDSCFAGDFFKGTRGSLPQIDEPYYQRAYEKPSRQALTSGSVEPVADGALKGHSPFAHWLLWALERNEKPYLTPFGLFDQIKEGVARNSGQTPRVGYLRDANNAGGEYVLFLRDAKTPMTVATGCGNVVTPTLQPYRFVWQEKDISDLARNQAYDPKVIAANPSRLVACVTAPKGCYVDFLGSLSKQITGSPSTETLEFGLGMYPFVFRRLSEDKPSLCGAMMVVNVDKVVALATFGRTDDTKLFSTDLLAKAGSGVLGKGTIAFDNKPVIFYWIGNRTKPGFPANSTVELDFNDVPNIVQVRVNDWDVKDRIAVVDVFTTTRDNYGPHESPATHKVGLRLKSGAKYVGYIRNLRADVFTTFMKVPCKIPADLFEAAEKGTIAKYTVTAGDDKQEVAEIVFGRESH